MLVPGFSRCLPPTLLSEEHRIITVPWKKNLHYSNTHVLEINYNLIFNAHTNSET
jgi:hypothetical protein